MPWGWQFAAFQAPAVVFLAAAWGLGRLRWGESDESHRKFTILSLGLLQPIKGATVGLMLKLGMLKSATDE